MRPNSVRVDVGLSRKLRVFEVADWAVWLERWKMAAGMTQVSAEI